MSTLTNQVCRQVNKVCIVLVDELHHGGFQQLVVELQVLSHLLQLDLLPTICYKQVHIKVILPTQSRVSETPESLLNSNI